MTDYQDYTDSELAELLREGEQIAFVEIYDRFAALLHRYSLSILGDPDKAQDAVHDVLLTLWERRDKLEIHTSLSAYLYTATRNRVRKHIRHTKVESAYLNTLQQLPNPGVCSSDEQLNEQELTRRFEEELRLLPPKMREAFELSRKQEYSYREISEKMQVSGHTVRNHISSALKILRARLSVLFYSLF